MGTGGPGLMLYGKRPLMRDPAPRVTGTRRRAVGARHAAGKPIRAVQALGAGGGCGRAADVATESNHPARQVFAAMGAEAWAVAAVRPIGP